MLTDLTLTDGEFLSLPLRIKRLARLNLLVGRNGVGKTRVLKAIHGLPQVPSIWVDCHETPLGCEYEACMGGAALIDEIGYFLHHTRMIDLWRHWHNVALEFDLQIFATTHSWDCIKGFAAALQDNDKVDGMVIRLERDGYWNAKGEMGAVLIDEDKLPIIIRDNIEIR